MDDASTFSSSPITIVRKRDGSPVRSALKGSRKKFSDSAGKKSTASKEDQAHVRFGVVDVKEFDRQIYLDAHGT
jgi:hypothetical protein